MKFKNPQTGKIYQTIVDAFQAHKCPCMCADCPPVLIRNRLDCAMWTYSHPLTAARLMGYEVIENNIPAPECGSREISHLITGDELLRQTAEEAVELAQAALKVIRAAKGTTPLDGEDAVDMLVEEIADVQNCIAVLSERLPGLQDKANKISAEKMKRWKERLR